jgi:hypothetical protein
MERAMTVVQRKSPKTYVSFRVNGGKPIHGSRANDVFADALEEMGLDKVATLGERVRGVALVSRTPEGMRGPKFREGWYIETSCSNDQKIGIAKKVADKLGHTLIADSDTDQLELLLRLKS